MSICLYTTAWGDYWEKYGKVWTEHINKLSPAPDKVIIISDRLIESEYEVIVVDLPDKYQINYFRNVAVQNSSCHWVVGIDLDDKPYTDILSIADYDYDVCTYSLDLSDGRHEPCRKDRWDNLFELDSYEYPMAGSSLIKTETIKKVGGYPMAWHEDAALWIKLRAINARVKFTLESKLLYNVDGNSLSRGNIKYKYDDLQNFFNYHKLIFKYMSTKIK